VASQPGSCFPEHDIVVEVAAPPGTFPLERLQPSATEPVSQRGPQPLLGPDAVDTYWGLLAALPLALLATFPPVLNRLLTLVVA
jgi:hypothetical protein